MRAIGSVCLSEVTLATCPDMGFLRDALGEVFGSFRGKGGLTGKAVQEELGIPVKAVGVGEAIDDLETFDPESFVDALLQ